MIPKNPGIAQKKVPKTPGATPALSQANIGNVYDL